MLEVRSADPERSGHPQITQITQMTPRPKSEGRWQNSEVRSEDTDRRGNPQITQITQIGSGVELVESVESADRNPEGGNL
jgi:hypothetical protein